MTCEDVIQGEIAEKYLHAELSEESREAFEQHYFECDRCFALLQAYRGLQAELARSRHAILAEAPGRSWIWRWGWAPATAAVVMAAGLALWQQPLTDTGSTPEGQPSTPASAPSPAGPPATPGPSLADLARVDPPPYTASRLRGVEDEAGARYHAAMKRYVQGDFRGAIAGLSAAATLDPEAPHVLFFLGVSRLAAGEPDAGIEALRRTIALGDSPFIEEARFFLAKGYLQKRDVEAAERELARAVQLRGAREAEARQMLADLKSLAKRAP
jgi:tetratricopeptide (TPR) repeat protein